MSLGSNTGGVPIPESLISSAIDSIIAPIDPRQVLSNTAEQIGQLMGANRSVVLLNRPDWQGSYLPIEWCSFDADPVHDRIALNLAHYFRKKTYELGDPLIVNDTASSLVCSPVQRDLESLGIRSFIALSLLYKADPIATLILSQCERTREYTTDDIVLLRRICSYAGTALGHSLYTNSLYGKLERYEAGVEHILDGVVQFDVNGNVCFANRKYEQIFGFDQSGCKGLRYRQILMDVVHPEDRERVVGFYAEALKTKKSVGPFEYRVKHVRDVQYKWLQDHIVPVIDAGKKLIGFQSSITVIPSRAGIVTQSSQDDGQYQELIDKADAIIFKTDAQFELIYVNATTSEYFGISNEQLSERGHRWFDFVGAEDRRRVEERAHSMLALRQAFDDEYRVLISSTAETKWLLVKVVPLFDASSHLIGWEGYGIDVTTRRETQDALDAQSKKVRALYTVSSAIRGYLDPANIASRGLAALVDATGADAAVCYLFPPQMRETLRLVAHYGFPAGFGQEIEEDNNLHSISHYVAKYGKSVVVPDLRQDPRVKHFYREEEGLTSAVLVPVCVDDETLGAIGLFSKTLNAFRGGDVMLVSAAANQIGLAARQAHLFSAYKRQTKTLAALYRISHELSSNLSLDEIFQRAFAVIRDELGLKRLWLGLLNEVGTRITGQAAYGPGWKRQLVQINADISDRNHPFAQVIAKQAPLVIGNNPELFEKFGIRKIFSRLAIESVVLVPLIGGGQVLGILAVQPRSKKVSAQDEDVGLLSNLANEIGAIVLTKRLEVRIGEAEKMRTAGILAGGVAHNFNNLLQAILGQASLLEMQSQNDARVERAAKIIHQAAVKGASLVKQLLSFSQLEEPKKDVCDISALIHRSKDSLSTLLREGQTLELQLSDSLPQIFADQSQLMRIIHGLVLNACEAMPNGGRVEIFTDTIKIDRESPHYEVPYGAYVRVGVRDTGVGMDAETKRRCFEPFFTTKSLDRSTGLGTMGAGLGLAAAYALARKNGGRLVVDSRLGFGSLFTIYVPIVNEGEVHETLSKRIEKEDAVYSSVASSVETMKQSAGILETTLTNGGKK